MRSRKSVSKNKRLHCLASQKGAVLVIVLVGFFAFLGFTALAIDIGHLAVVGNELQNAADAGALAGAADLYYPEGTVPKSKVGTVNDDSNKTAWETALKNTADGSAVEVKDYSTNKADVQRGHWNMKTRTFTQSDVLDPVNLAGATKDDLDKMDGTYTFPPGTGNKPIFINAVKVIARREATPAKSFFAGIFGIDGFARQKDAIAIVGPAGPPVQVDVPIVICEGSLRDADGKFTCNLGRLINSSDKTDSNTGAWTNLSEGCAQNFNASDLKDLIDYPDQCIEADRKISTGTSISTGGGQVQGPFDSLRMCGSFFNQKELSKDPTLVQASEPWEVNVPVVDCRADTSDPDSPDLKNPSGCMEVIGTVTMEIIMITDVFPATAEKKFEDLVPVMAGCIDTGVLECTSTADGTLWDGSALTGEDRWNSYVDAFDLEISPGVPATADNYYQKAIYAKPDCEFKPEDSTVGGTMSNKLARFPVLVK
ncbi:pilus assembly protein TadG-related protein [uncultured Desulfuromonas sp.]|mgnify:CR=1 FL=1|uniref:TadG family pilus assembly protein n=1 Tax=uncultured Desulfuromonas sp. TaxID=181013 RepID=UPI00262770AF|nr:pilus assembly protein TadG-related protein [uncultured Desulfuromonas sp.]